MKGETRLRLDRLNESMTKLTAHLYDKEPESDDLVYAIEKAQGEIQEAVTEFEAIISARYRAGRN